MVIYDKHYKKLEYFGQPYKKFVDFFARLNPKATLLDLGCGQGRDSLATAKLGYKVTGVYISKVGIEQMILQASKLNLSIKGIVSDIYTFNDIRNYDIILLDSMLHFYKKDIKKKLSLLK